MTDKNETPVLEKLADALVEIKKMSLRATDGKWLERLTAGLRPSHRGMGCPRGVDVGGMAWEKSPR